MCACQHQCVGAGGLFKAGSRSGAALAHLRHGWRRVLGIPNLERLQPLLLPRRHSLQLLLLTHPRGKLFDVPPVPVSIRIDAPPLLLSVRFRFRPDALLLVTRKHM